MNSIEQKKRAIMFDRFCGIIISMLMIIFLLLFYFNIIDKWVLCLTIASMAGLNFIINASILERKNTTFAFNINLILSAVFFTASMVFLIYGLLNGEFILF